MEIAFEKYLKRRIFVSDLNWHKFFTDWKQKKTTIIEFTSHLRSIYQPKVEITNVMWGAWRRMMKGVGCTNITPFGKDESDLEFWTYAEDPSNDQALIRYLYTTNLLNNVPYDPSVKNNELQKQMNKRGLDGKQRILSVIADNFVFDELQEKLKNKLIKESERLRLHLRRGFEEELSVNEDDKQPINYESNNVQLLDVGETFELKKGWALKGNQKYGKRGGGKRMTKRVKSYLEGYFLAGNINKSDRMAADEMVSELQVLAQEGEIPIEEVPGKTTVANWIKHYAAGLKQLAAKRVEESNTIRDSQNNIRNADCFRIQPNSFHFCFVQNLKIK
nr:7859_t:CDS:2 [Entrophospora candida]